MEGVVRGPAGGGRKDWLTGSGRSPGFGARSQGSPESLINWLSTLGLPPHLIQCLPSNFSEFSRLYIKSIYKCSLFSPLRL